MKQDVSKAAKNVKVNREEFGVAISKLLQAAPIPKIDMSRRIKSGDRRSDRPTKPLPDRQ
jgi:hypothetical protein